MQRPDRLQRGEGASDWGAGGAHAKASTGRAGTAEDAELYQERWEIELGFRDLKSSMQRNAVTLRSKTIELVYQEAWSLLLAYNIIRREASQAAVAYGRAPSEIRFKPACHYIAAQLIVMLRRNRHRPPGGACPNCCQELPAYSWNTVPGRQRRGRSRFPRPAIR